MLVKLVVVYVTENTPIEGIPERVWQSLGKIPAFGVLETGTPIEGIMEREWQSLPRSTSQKPQQSLRSYSSYSSEQRKQVYHRFSSSKNFSAFSEARLNPEVFCLPMGIAFTSFIRQREPVNLPHPKILLRPEEAMTHNYSSHLCLPSLQ